jgi:leucyl/phenylalanyl-tRNA--protein transferase
MALDIPSLIQGYAQGYFLMADESGTLGWYSSRTRAIIPLDGRFRYPTSLRRVLNQERFSVAINRDFKSVVAGWGDQLAGGILGIVIGGAFIGESMFYRIPEGSKVAMVQLVERLRRKNFLLFDAQMMNPHLERFGACTVEEPQYQVLLRQALQRQCSLD